MGRISFGQSENGDTVYITSLDTTYAISFLHHPMMDSLYESLDGHSLRRLDKLSIREVQDALALLKKIEEFRFSAEDHSDADYMNDFITGSISDIHEMYTRYTDDDADKKTGALTNSYMARLFMNTFNLVQQFTDMLGILVSKGQTGGVRPLVQKGKSKTCTELRSILRNKGVKGCSGMDKAQLLKAVAKTKARR